MRRIPTVFCSCLALASLAQPVYAEGQNACRTTCDADFATCQQQLSAFAPLNAGLLAEKDFECRQKLEACHAACAAVEPRIETPEEPLPEPTPPPEI